MNPLPLHAHTRTHASRTAQLELKKTREEHYLMTNLVMTESSCENDLILTAKRVSNKNGEYHYIQNHYILIDIHDV